MTMHASQRAIADQSYFVNMYFAGAPRNPQRVTNVDLDTPAQAAEFALAYMQEHERAEHACVHCFVQYTDGSSEIIETPLCQLSREDLPEHESMAPH